MFDADWFFELEKILRARGLDSDSKTFDEICWRRRNGCRQIFLQMNVFM